MSEFLIILMIWLGLLDPTATYTVGQTQQIAETNTTLLQNASASVDTTSTSWQYAREQQKDIIIIDPTTR